MVNLRYYIAGRKEWIFESGCTDHMTEDKDMFHESTPNHGPQTYVTFVDKSKDKLLGLEYSKDWLWHRRLGHVGMSNLNSLIKGNHIHGVKYVIFNKYRLCSACQAGKQVGGSHPMKNIMTTRRPLKLLHMDLFGPNAYKSLGGNSYGFVIVDDFFRFTWVFFLDDKPQVQNIPKSV